MNLSEVHLLSSDLSILDGLFLDDFFVRKLYSNHNGFAKSMIFPASMRASGTFSPVLIKVGRWGRLVIFQFTTCTIVFRMAYRTRIAVARGKTPFDLDKSTIASLMTLAKIPNSDDKTYLFFLDPLKCGSATVYPLGETPVEFSYLGMDVLDLSFTTRYLMTEITKHLMADKERNIKSFIMDKNVIAWLDNAVATEALFISGINPFSKISNLDTGRIGALVKSLKVVYRRAIELVRNDFQRTEKVSLDAIYSTYGRDGKPCAVCEEKIVKAIINGLNTYWCPKCQVETIKSGDVL